MQGHFGVNNTTIGVPSSAAQRRAWRGVNNEYAYLPDPYDGAKSVAPRPAPPRPALVIRGIGSSLRERMLGAAHPAADAAASACFRRTRASFAHARP